MFFISSFCFKSHNSEADEVINVIKSANYRTLRAEVYYQESKGAINFPRLKITNAGQIVLIEPLIIDGQNSFSKIVTPLAVDLDSDWEAEIVVDISPKGARGLDYSLIYKYDASKKKYVCLTRKWLHYSLGRTIQDVDKDGSLEFVTYDNRFSDKFSPFDDSVRPIKIWKFQNNQIVDVTTQYKSLVYSNATKLWEAFDEQRRAKKQDLVLQKALLAAYLGDKYTLREEEDGWDLLKANYRYRDQKKYFNLLKAFLEESGYIRMQRETVLETNLVH